MKLLITFTILSVANVILSTLRSLLTINGNKYVASISSAIYFGFYTVMLIYTVADFPLWQKVVVTVACNLVGVFVVKLFEEKSKKEKLWKIEVTVPTENAKKVNYILEDIPHSEISVDDSYILFNFYCNTKKESEKVHAVVKQFNAKYFVTESKSL